MKIIFVVNVDWFFISHRLPLALEALKRGYEVHIACGITDKKEYLEKILKKSGFEIVEIKEFFLHTDESADKLIFICKKYS